MPTLTSVTVNLRGDSSSLVKATRAGLKGIRNLSNGIGATVARVGGLAAAITGLAGGAGLLALGKASARNVDAIGKLSTQLGISNTDVQKLGLVAELSGVKTEGLTKAMQRVTRMVGDAGAGGKEATKLFDRLGLSLADLTRVDAVTRFRMVVTALNGLNDATKKASIGNKLFEEQWQRLNPLLLGFEDSFKRAAMVFDKLKFGLGNAAGGVESLNDNFSVAQTMLTAFRDLVFAKVAPSLDHMVVSVGKLAEAWIEAEGGAGKLADTLINKVVGAAGAAVGPLQNLKDAVTGIAWTFGVLVDSVQAVGQLGAAAAAAGSALLRGEASGAGAIVRDAGAEVANVFMGGAPGQEDTTAELKSQTELLRQIANGERGMVF